MECRSSATAFMSSRRRLTSRCATACCGLLSRRAPLGERLPFDFFLSSLADAFGERAVCVILSGTGADGSVGLKAVSEKGGLVIAQDPDEAAYDGMPRSAIATGTVNLVLPAGQIPQALIRYAHHPYVTAGLGAASADKDDKSLSEIIELLREQTSRDFAHYRKATLPPTGSAPDGSCRDRGNCGLHKHVARGRP
jgi:CheB methylesterase